MENITPPQETVDYLVIGHLACDIALGGKFLGGTAAYSSLTAKALGLRVGIVTAWAGEVSLDPLAGIQIVSIPAEVSTTFENAYTPEGRVQILHERAPRLIPDNVPEIWRRSSIIHIGPIAQEVDSHPWDSLSPNLLALTAQGWLRHWNDQGRVSACTWKDSAQALKAAGATVISIEDVDGDEDEIERMSLACRVLAVTEGPAGARLYWHNDLRRFRAPQKKEVDATGAGDIFASAFFVRLIATRDPWEAARFATQLAAFSVTRSGLEGIPTQEEIKTCLMEVF
jgi:sugar/nucleoside kinase (ribokinase family)